MRNHHTKLKFFCFIVLFFFIFHTPLTAGERSPLLEKLYSFYNEITPLYKAQDYAAVLEAAAGVGTGDLVYEKMPGTDKGLSESQEVFLILLWYKANSYYFLDRYEEALLLYETVIAHYPNLDGYIFGYYATISWKKGDKEKAFSILDNGLILVKAKRDKAIIYWYRSSFSYEAGDYTKAIDAGEKGYNTDYTLIGPVYYEFLSLLMLSRNREALNKLFIILDHYFRQNLLDYLPDIYSELTSLRGKFPEHPGIGTGLWLVSEAMERENAGDFLDKTDESLISSSLFTTILMPHGMLYYLFARYYSLRGYTKRKEEYAHYCYATGAGLVEYDGEKKEYFFTRDENDRIPWSAENYLFQKARSAANSGTGSKEAELVLQMGHSHAVWGLEYNRQGNLFLSTSLDNTIKLWRVDGHLLRTYKGHTDDVNKALFIPGSNTIVSAGQDNTIRFWDIEGTLLKTIEDAHPDSVEGIGVSPDGSRIFTASIFYKPELTEEVTFDITSNNNVSLKIWSSGGECLKTIDIENIEQVNELTVSPDGKYFFTAHGHFLFGQGDNMIRMWNLNGQLVGELKGHNDVATCVAVSPDSEVVVSGSKNGEIIIWNLKEKHSFVIIGSTASINDIAFSPDGKLFATVSGAFAVGDEDETVKLWTRDGRLLNVMKGHIDSVMEVVFDDEGRIIASGSKDGTVKLWSLDGKLIRTFEGNWNFLHACAWSPDGNIIATGSNEDRINLWERTGSLYRSITPDSRYVGALDYSPDGKILASGSGDGTIRLWDREGRPLTSFNAHKTGIIDLRISPDGSMIVSSGFDSTLCLWDMTGKLIKDFGKFESALDAIGFTPGNTSIAAGIKQEIVFYNFDGKEIKRIPYQDAIETLKRPFDYIRSFAFSPDGKYMAATADDPFGNGNHAVKVFDREGNLLHDFRGHTNGISRLAFCPNSRYVASGSIDTTVRLWDVQTGEGKVLQGHFDKIEDLDFSPDGRFLVSTGYDTTIRIWNVETGEGFGIVNRGEEWISYTEDGFFDASRGGGRIINMVKGTDAYGIDQFSASRNRPDILLKKAGIGDEETIEHYHIQYIKRLIKNNYIPDELTAIDYNKITSQIKNKPENDFLESCYTVKGDTVALSHELTYQEKLTLFSIPAYLNYVESILDSGFHVPVVAISQVRKDDRYAYLTFTCRDSLYNVISYNIFVNDVPVFGTGGKTTTQEGKEVTVDEKIELSDGRLKIEVSCTNEKLAESFRDLVMIDHKEKGKGDLYYIGFGVSDYADSSLDLLYPHKDVEDMKNLFMKMDKHFNHIYTYVYTDTSCTVENIKNARWFLRNAQADDTVILFISGHGVHDSDTGATYYYLTHEADVNNLAGSAANFDVIEDILDNIKPRKKLFLMDTCESGEIDDEYVSDYLASSETTGIRPRAVLKLNKKEEEQKGAGNREKRSYFLNKNRFIYNDIFRRTGAIVFSSSRGGEYSYEPGFYTENENGFFTGALIRAFLTPETDTDRDGAISTDELKNSVIKAVSIRSKGLQNPTVDRDNIYLKLSFPVAGRE
ncbi:MAG: caspase family protein [Spirochaetales bacterium]|nr:caspase family protein [Spirochaetales bacterium]